MTIRLRSRSQTVTGENDVLQPRVSGGKLRPSVRLNDTYVDADGNRHGHGEFAGYGSFWGRHGGVIGVNAFETEDPTDGRERSAHESSDGERRAEFLRSLTELSDRGVALRMLPGVFVHVEDVSDEDYPYVQSLLKVIYDMSIFEATDGQIGDGSGSYTILDESELDPQAFLEASFGHVLLSDTDLVDEKAKGNRKAEVFPYTMDFTTVGEELHVTALNWVTGKIVFDVYYPRSDRGVAHWESLAYQLGKALDQDFFTSGFYKRRIKDLPRWEGEGNAVEGDDLYGDAEMQAWSEADLKASNACWNSLFRDFDVTFVSQPAGSNVDSLVRHIPLELKSDGFAGRDMGPVNVNGHVEGFIIAPKDKRTALRLADDSLMQKYVETEYVRDKYGNFIIPMFEEVGKRRKRLAFSYFQVIPPYQFEHGMKSGEDFAPLGVDLTAFGFGDYPLLAKAAVEKEIPVPELDQPYHFYSQVWDKTREEQFAAYSRVADVAASAERFFAFEPRNVIKAIDLTPSLEENAFVSLTNPDTIQVLDEIFDALTEEDGIFIGSHESFHAIDLFLGLSEDVEILSIYETIAGSYEPMLFDAIDEKNYLTFEGGHSADDVNEFVASLLNTVYTDKFGPALDKMDGKTRDLYYHALEALLHAIESSGKVAADAPVLTRIESALLALSWGREAVPAVGELIVPRVEDILLSPPLISAEPTEVPADMPVPVLSAVEFASAVTQFPGVSFVYVYNEDEQANAPLLRQAEADLLAKGIVLFAIPYHEADDHLARFDNELGGGRVYVFENGQARGYMSVADLGARMEELRQGDPIAPELP